MSQVLNLAALVAAAVAVSVGDHKRRIAGFLASANGMEIPDEQGHRWFARLQDDGFVRLEESWNNGGFREHFVRVEDLEALRVGADLEVGSQEDKEGLEWDGSQEAEVGISIEKVHGLTVLVARLQDELKAKEAWTPELEEDLDAWFLSLEDSEMESLVAVGLAEPEKTEEESRETEGTGQGPVAPGQGTLTMPPAPELEVPGLTQEPKAGRGKKDKTNADV